MLLSALGALSMLAQVVVLRELVAALFGIELLYVVALGAWLLGTAAGAAAGRRIPASPATAVAGFAVLGILVPGELVLVRAAGTLTGAVPGAYLPFPIQVAWILAAAVPPAAVCGLLFPPLAGLASARGTRLARGYAVESAGAAGGGVLVTVLFWLGASTLQVTMAASVLAFAAAAAAAWRRRGVAAGAMALLTLALALALHHSRAWDLALLRWQHPALADAVDTPYARIAITRQLGQVAVFENGALTFDTEGTSAEAFADIAALQHPAPRRALVIGGGFEGVPGALRAHRVPSIDNIEIDRRAYDAIRGQAGPVPRDSPGTADARVMFGEPRRLLERAAPYDLILVATGEPASGASSRFYTREFFRLCARRLSHGGVLAVRLAAAENLWPRPLARRTASIFSAMRLEFASVEAVPGATLYLFASDVTLPRDPAILSSRLVDRGVHPRLMTPPYLGYLYSNDRRDEVRRVLESTRTGGPNRDAAPVCYQYAAMLWLSKFYPDLAVADVAERGLAQWGTALAVLAALTGSILWLRRRPRRRVAGLLFGAGFIGMVIESVLLLRYQIANGIIFQQVGWLLTCFMAGLTGGGWLCSREGKGSRLTPTAALLAAAAAAWAASAVQVMAGLAGTSLMLLLTGAAVGTCFAFGAAVWQGERREAAAALYAADVAGGAAGAILATLLMIPAAGLAGSALLVTVLAAALAGLSPGAGFARP